MSDTLQKALIWRISIARFILYSIASLWTCWATATNQIDLTHLDNWAWFQTIGGCLGSWCLVVIAYLDKSVSQISRGEVPGVDEKETK